MTSASTGMPKKGTQTPSTSPDLIPARNRPRDHSIKSEICLNGGVQPKQRQVCQSQIVSTAGFTPAACAEIVLWRRREISTTVPVAYCTLLTATTEVLSSIASMSVSVKSHVRLVINKA